MQERKPLPTTAIKTKVFHHQRWSQTLLLKDSQPEHTHSVRYMFLVGESDTSVSVQYMNKYLNQEDMNIRKIEYVNHALKNYQANC